MENKIIQCPSCGKKMQIPPTFFGKKIKCPQCSSVLVIDAQGGVSLGAPAAPPQAAPTPAAPPQKAPAPAAPPASPEQPAAEAPKLSAPKPKMKPKPDLRPKSAVTKPKAQMKQGMKVAGKATKGKLQVQKVKAKKRVSGIKIQKTNKKLGKEKLSAVSRFEKKKKSGALSKLGMVLGVIAIVAAAAYIFLGTEEPKTQDPTPTQVLPQSYEFKDMGEEEIMDYNAVGGRVHVWKRIINSDINIPNAKPEDGESVIKIKNETDFVLIPGGEYVVGYNDEGDLKQDQSPEIKVKVNDFYISRKEITIGQFRNFLKHIEMLENWQETLQNDAEKFYFQGPEIARNYLKKAAVIDPTIFNHPDQPKDVIHRVEAVWNNEPAVYKISWWSAYAYCAWANSLDPNKGNLPTEIEWEVAARGKKGNLFPWGNKISDIKTPADADEKAIYQQYGFYTGDTTPYDPQAEDDSPLKFTPKMNSFGVYDMAGNVSEWCFDTYVMKLYSYIRDANAANGEEAVDYKIFYPGGASEQDKQKYGIEPGNRAARTNSSSMFTEQRSNMKFTVRTSIDSSNATYAVGFRCVYYKDAPAPNAELLKKLYDRRKKMVEYKWAKEIAESMLEYANTQNIKDQIVQAEKEMAEFKTKYKDMIAQEAAADDDDENEETPDENPEVQPDTNTDTNTDDESMESNPEENPESDDDVTPEDDNDDDNPAADDDDDLEMDDDDDDDDDEPNPDE